VHINELKKTPLIMTSAPRSLGFGEQTQMLCWWVSRPGMQTAAETGHLDLATSAKTIDLELYVV